MEKEPNGNVSMELARTLISAGQRKRTRTESSLEEKPNKGLESSTPRNAHSEGRVD